MVATRPSQLHMIYLVVVKKTKEFIMTHEEALKHIAMELGDNHSEYPSGEEKSLEALNLLAKPFGLKVDTSGISWEMVPL